LPRLSELDVFGLPSNPVQSSDLLWSWKIENYAHLDELDVLPSHEGKGIGTTLLATVCSWAKDMGYPAVTLRTFRDVPWNAPFYQRRGFRIVESEALSLAHVGLEASERQRGLRTDLRVTMVYETAG
jgi:GNAT superfamily N-acetyltransferase